MPNTDPSEWRLFDTDLTSVLNILPAKQQSLYLQLNEPGSGELKIPLDSDAAANVGSAMYAEGAYRGAVRSGFFVENITKDHANSGENEGRVLSLSGRGPLALLEDGIVWDDGTSSTTRNFSAATKAAILITLIEEAKDRNCLANLTYDFDAANDSNSVAWDDSEPLTFNVGTSLLEVVRQIAKVGIDFDINSDGAGNFVLSAYKDGLGSDKSSTVFFRVGVNCEEVSSLEAGSEIRNVLRVKYRDGFTTVKDNTSITNRRRREALMDAAYAGNSEVAQTFGQADLEWRKDPKHSITVKIYDGVGPRAFVDYSMGDTISLDINGTVTSYRIRGILPSWDGDDYADVEVDLNSTILENEIRVGQDVNWLKNVWETAHDAGLLDVAFWAQLGDATNDGQVNVMHLVGRTVYVGGRFTKIGKIEANYIATYDIDTKTWSPLGTGLVGPDSYGGSTACNAIDSIGADIYFGGNFASADGVAAHSIVKYSSSTFTPLGTGLNNACNALAHISTDLFAGGDFTTAGGLSACSFIAKWNGSWSGLSTGLTGSVYALAANGSDLYSTGQFTSTVAGLSANRIIKWNGSYSALGSGLSSNEGLALLIAGLYLYVGGTFGSAGGVSYGYLAKWHLTDNVWSSVGDVGAPSSGIYSLATDGIKIYVGGNFTSIGDISANGIAVWNLGSWSALGSGLELGYVLSIIVSGLTIYAGGGFQTVDGKSCLYFSAWMQTFPELMKYLDDQGSTFDLGRAIHAASPKTTLAGLDEFPIWNSVTQLLAKITVTNLVTAIKALFTYTEERVMVSATLTGILTVADAWWYKSTGGTFGQIYHGHDYYTTAQNYVEQLAVENQSGHKEIYVTSDTLTDAPRFYGSHGGGDKTTTTATLAGMVLCELRGKGWDAAGSQTNGAVIIRLVAEADWSPTSHPTMIEFWVTPVGSTTMVRSYYIGSDQIMYDDGGTPIGSGGGGGREILTANRTYYVRTDGNDANDGLTNSSGGSFLTWQHAVDVAKTLDLSGYTVTIRDGTGGTYAENVEIKNIVGGTLVLEGLMSNLDSLTAASGVVGSGATRASVTRNSGTWTASARKHKSLRATAGNNNGKSQIIDDNTTTVATCNGYWSGGAWSTDTFVVEDWGTTIQKISVVSGQKNVILKGLKIKRGSVDYALYIDGDSDVTIRACWIQAESSGAQTVILCDGSRVVFDGDYGSFLDMNGNTSAGTYMAQIRNSFIRIDGTKVFLNSKTNAIGFFVVFSRGEIKNSKIDGFATALYLPVHSGFSCSPNGALVYNIIVNAGTGLRTDANSAIVGTTNNQYSGNTANETATGASYGYID